MTTAPNAGNVPVTEEQLRQVTIGELRPHSGPVELAEYDLRWPELFEQASQKIRSALGSRLLQIEHVGSTSVPGLAAKPQIDVLVVVAASADEPEYAPALEAVGYVLRIREPDWHQHRLLHGSDPAMNIHVFSAGCSEIERMLRFRDWLRGNEADRRLYERTKRELSARNWKYVQNYADAKSAVVEEILARAAGRAQPAATPDKGE